MIDKPFASAQKDGIKIRILNVKSLLGNCSGVQIREIQTKILT